MHLFKRLDDLYTIEQLMDIASNIIIVPRRNIAIAWIPPAMKDKIQKFKKRIIEVKETKNKFLLVRLKLSL